MAKNDLSIYFIDVGQGDATLIHQPGKCAMLVDTGSAGAGPIVASLLSELEIGVLDYVVVTHPHQDHFGGLTHIADKVEIKEFSDNGDMNVKEPGFVEYSELQYQLPYSVIGGGDAWSCGDLSVDVLHPSVSYNGKNTNDRSLALGISYHGFSLLLMGDVAGDGEKEMLRISPIPHAAVIQLGHHGAQDSTSGWLLDRVRPKVAIVSVGRQNGIKAPAADVLGRLAERGVRAFRTDLEGTIRIKVMENGNYRITP